jgi:hypothetical protein
MFSKPLFYYKRLNFDLFCHNFSGCDVGSGFEFSGSGEFSGEEGDYEIVTDDPDPTSDEVPDANGDGE